MNEIVQENAILEGRTDRSYWDVPHSTQIEGFATDMSVNAGTRVDFKINVNGGAGSDYIVEIFRLGYYGGSGAREVAQWTNTNATVQPNALVDASRGLVDAGNWSVTDGWNVPANAVSGVYLARVQRLDSNGDPIEGAVNQIPFVVRNDGETHDIVLQTSDTTWQAYNGWGGNNGEVGANLYGDMNNSINWDPIPGAGNFSQDRAYAVSYNRPFIDRDGTSYAGGAQNYLFGADYAAIYWLEKQGYDVSYISGVDTDRLGADYLKNYESFISVGHDEYWSGDQRANVEEARDSGVNLLFWSGNEVYWKTRWEVAYSADGTAYRTLVCYKETLAVADSSAGPADYYNLDPSDIWTGTWMDTRFHGNPLAGGGNLADVDPMTGLNPACHCAQNQLTGQLFGPDGTGQFGGALDVPSNYASLRVWRDTTVANGGSLDMSPGILGYEWDTSPDDNMRPAGLIKLSETTLPWNGILIDQGNTTAPGVATHTLSLYRTESGSLVFGAGTTFWSWALSNEHDSSPYGADIENVDIQQFTINMFADMGIQPGVADAFLISQGLKRASASTDTIAAVASINNLPDTVEALTPVTITGTATDNDGNPLTTDGRVAAVEVSVDGGNTWKVANSADNWATWSFYWYPTAQGAQTIKARAIDDSLNVYNITPDSEAVTVTPSTTFSAFGGHTPGSPVLTNEATTIELGMRFAVDRVGSVTELKYWRGSGDAGDTDVREGHLWRADGTLLATVIFTSGLSQVGWQVATLSSPVTLTAGTQYIVSYRTNDNYVSTGNYFVNANDVAFDGLDNDSFWGSGGVVRVVQDGAGGTNGVFHYGSGTAVMPSESYNGANYWVDITFDALNEPVNSPPVITSAAAMTSPENRLTAGTITATDGDVNPLTYAIVGGADAARFTINAQTGVLSFVSAPDYEAPADAGANNVYDLTVSVSDGIAPAVTKDITVTVTDRAENGTGSSVFGSSDAPTTTQTTDPTDYELGMRFTANAAGIVSELRYFRGAADANDTDTRVLNLWNAAGALLGSVTVASAAGESGWQVGVLSAPIAIQAGATYVVSYGTTQNYAYTANYFTTAHSGPDGVLTAAAASGVFAEGTPGAFPTATYNSANYWVDVTFTPNSALPNSAPVITSAAALTSPENRLTAGTITATDANANPLTYAIAGGADAALFTIDAQTGLLSFVTAPNYEAPADAGANNAYDLTVSVSDGIAPAVTKEITVTVTDRVENGVSTVFDADEVPATTETTDPADYELGMRFTANATGSITELRYFRGAADANDADTRVLHLWTAAGVLLGSVTVASAAGESGWQVGTLSAPIAIEAGATYVVSYGTTQNYVTTANYFTATHSGPDGVLTAGVASGVFAEATGYFPTASYNSSNYWVDVTFIPNSAPVITSGANLTSPENRSFATTITATDANGSPLTYSIAGGADAALFTIDAQTGLLRFVSNPNYEAPADAGANNVYDLTVSVSDGIAPAATKAITVTVTDRAENGTGSNVFGLTDAPATTETTDPVDYELGMRFTANGAGTISELRYFRGAADANDADTRVLNLWSAAGILLGSVTVASAAGESGWQVGTLSAPIAIEAGATYVVSYGTTQNYVATANYFTTAHSGPDGVLTAGVASGVFAEGTPGTFPTASYNSSNYWVDVTFIPVSEPAVLSSATVGLSETNAVLATGGTLTISDVDSPETFVAQAGTVGSYGTFTIDAAGVWSYTASSAHDAFVAGTTYSDTFQVASADGTRTSVTVNILGTNDAAVLSSATVGLSETNTVLATGGTLTISDVDSPQTFVAQAGTVGSYGTFTIDAAGVWSYTASSAHDAFVGGTTYSDTFQVASADGTTTSVTVNILGTSDAVVVSSLTITGTQISFVATDPDNGTLALASPFAAPFANPAIASEATTSLTPASQAAAVSGTLQVTDGSATADVIGLYLGTGSGDSFTAGSTSTAIYGFGGSDILAGGTAADVIFGGTGADTIAAGGGNDTINLANGDFASGESIDGGANSDTIVLTNGTTVDFTLGTVTNVEALTGSTDSDTVTLSALQLAGLGTVDLVSGTDTLNVVANGNISQLALAALSNIDTRNLIGTSGTDSITLSGAQLDTILTGSDTINLGSGTGDTINLTSTSSALNTLGASNTSIQGVEAISAATAGAGVTITLSGQTEAFSITGSANADTITAGGGNDTINLANGQFISGESIDGGANSDAIVLTNGTTVDFSGGTVTNVETLTGSTSSDTVTLSALQLAGLGTVNLVSGTDTLNVVANGNISQLALATMSNIDTGHLTGTAGTDSITLSGAQLNAILTGSATINLGSGTGDTINLTSTSSDLNTLGASNTSIQGVEVISATTAGAGVTITLSGQTEAFSITGSSFADIITGGEGADTIAAGGGNDTINLANGDFASGESIDGGANSDTIVLTNGTTVDFSGGTVTNVETLTGSTSSDTVTLSALQLAGLGNVSLVGGFTDTLNVVANGNISQLALATMSNIDTGNLIGTSGTDSITLTGAQLNAILTGSATINLGSGAGDTINLTSTSSDLNSLGASNSSIQGVEAISAATATAGVTITLSGQTEAFSITGSANADTITGGTGGDTIAAGVGNDILTGGTGSDQFVFNTALNAATNVDQITDFNVAADTIILDDAIYSTIVGSGTLTAAQFVANTAGTAQDASDRIVYETDTGKLFYDSNGDAAGGATQFAQLAAGLALTNNDFLIL
jgi:VCBS repeat-containing protein